MDKILITGTSGFIGQELSRMLLSDKHEIHQIHHLDRYVTGKYRHYQNEKTDKVTKHYVDLKDEYALVSAVRELSPDYIIHLASISPVAYSYDNYMEVSNVNYLASINLAEAARKIPNFKQFIFAGTSEEYGMTLTDKKHKLTESAELKPNSPYAVAKVSADLYLQYMGQAYGFPYTVIRPFNTFGRKDNDHFFIEHTITQMLKNPNGEVLLGDPATVRDWLYVDDHVSGYMKALGNKKAIGQKINICTGKGYTTRETADIIAKMAGFDGRIVWNSVKKRPLDAKILIGDNTKARKLLGWEPKYDLGKGLEKTISFWKGKMKLKE